MNRTAESVVREFLATWAEGDSDKSASFFTEDAEFIDRPRATHKGIEAIRAAIRADFSIVPSFEVKIRALVSDGRTVFVERVDHFEVLGVPFEYEAVSVFEVESTGSLRSWREYYDLKSVEEKVYSGLSEARGYPRPGTRP